MTGFFIFVLFVGGIAAFAELGGAKKRIQLLEENVRYLRDELEWMRRKLKELRADAAPEPAAFTATEAPQTEEVAAPPPIVEPPPAPAVEIQPDEVVPAPAVQELPAAAFSAMPAESQPEAQPAEAASAPPVTPPYTPPAAASPAGPRPPARSFDWESLIGVKLFSWIAGVALVLAALFFLRYSVEQGWFSPTVRATIGLITGVALLVVCEMRVARGYEWTANAMHGAGIAILYATLFAMHAMWHLVPAPVVFFLMLVVTAVAVMLSIRRDSVFIALLGLMGGFATPALLSTGENRPIGLFAYLLLLNAGLAWVAFRKGWPALTLGSLLFTVVYQWAWIGKFLTTSQLPLAAGIFVLFALVGTSAMWTRGAAGQRGSFRRIAMASAILPLAFAVFGAAVPAYGARYNVLFAFLVLMTSGLAAIAIVRGPEWLHVAGGVATVLTFAIWSGTSYSAAAWPWVLLWLAAFVLLYTGAAYLRYRPSRGSEHFGATVDRGVYVAGLLFFLFPVLAAREPLTGSPGILFGALFALLLIVGAFVIRRGQGIAWFTACFFAILTEAVWSAKYLAPESLLPALLIYGGFGIVFLAVPAVARKLNNRLQPASGTAVTVILSLLVLIFLTSHAIAASALWGLALLLSIMIAGTFIESRSTSRPLLAAVAIVVAWIVLALWWAAAPLSTSLFPALFVIAVFGIVVIAGSMWTARGNASAEFGNMAHLGLAGHLFLMFVASQARLSIPPWPWFAVLLVLDLAIGVAVLYLRRGSMLIGAAVASQLVLMIWASVAVMTPWPVVALIATIAVAAYALIWYALGRRFGIVRDERLAAAIAGLLLGDVVAMIAGGSATTPLFAPLLATHVILLIALMVLAWITETHVLAVVGAAAAAIATSVARTSTPLQEFTFAAVLYALFIAYPLLLGARAKKAIEPYLGALVASAALFFFTYDAMETAGLKWMIGVLPVAEALVMLALLVRLLRFEPPSDRQLTRLATVAGAALAFITIAIPLQLDKQWITIAWALEAAALVWLFTRVPHRGLLAWAAALFAAAFVRLILNPAVLSYHPVSHTAILNWYLYTYLVAAAAFFAGAYYWPRSVRWGKAATASAGTILLFALLNIEIADFYSRGRTLTFNFFSSSLAQDLTYTMGWALFAIAMLVAGIALARRAARVAAILLLVVTILKCFLHDLARLGGLYRVGSLLGLAASLVVVGLLLQRFVMHREQKPVQETA